MQTVEKYTYLNEEPYWSPSLLTELLQRTEPSSSPESRDCLMVNCEHHHCPKLPQLYIRLWVRRLFCLSFGILNCGIPLAVFLVQWKASAVFFCVPVIFLNTAEYLRDSLFSDFMPWGKVMGKNQSSGSCMTYLTTGRQKGLDENYKCIFI